jgi:predicted O-methyltransferase YrrM
LDDLIMQARFREIVAEYGIKVIVETGTLRGYSTFIFSKMARTVLSVDNNPENLRQATHTLLDSGGCDNVVLVAGNSPNVLEALRPLLPDETLYFLDAHWQSYWPILDEIREIRSGTGVIVIHDFLIPDRPDLGFDTYTKYAGLLDGSGEMIIQEIVTQPLNYEYVKDALTAWSPTHRVEYNTEAQFTEGVPDTSPRARGVAYIFPK